MTTHPGGSSSFELLGPVRVLGPAGPVPLGRGQRAVLAMLLLEAGRPVAVHRLVEGLWERAPTSAVNAVQVHVSGLRRALTSAMASVYGTIETVADGYALHFKPGSLDLHVHEMLVERGHRELTRRRYEAAASAFRSAERLWRGEPLADVGERPFAARARVHLEEQRLSALVARADAELCLAPPSALAAELQRHVQEHPLHEGLRSRLILALARSGQQARALEVYSEARARLTNELGVDPGPELEEAHLRVLRHQWGTAPLSPGDPSPQSVIDVRDRSRDLSSSPPWAPGLEVALPRPLNAFVGRQSELREVIGLLVDPTERLITLVGTGGTGKSRLALAAADAVSASFPEGAFFVGLASLVEHRDVVPEIRRVIDAPQDPSSSELEDVARALASRRALLVLDNFEHVAEAAPAVSRLLLRCPGLTVLVTSRCSLAVYGERLVRVAPLTLPELGEGDDPAAILACDAVQLFGRRAAAASGLRVDTDNARLVGEICARVDGLPLALELAAARTAVLDLPDLLPRLERSLGVLTGGPSDVPERQRTMRATLDWSFELLSCREAEVLAALAVFVGGWTIRAAEHVCSVPEQQLLELLQRLVDRGLVVAPREGRFAMLRVVREYACERLAADDPSGAVDRRFADWCITLSQELHSRHSESGSPAGDRGTAAEFERELANFVHALDWAVAQADHGRLTSLLVPLLPYFFRVGSIGMTERWVSAATSSAAPDGARSSMSKALASLALVQRGDPGAAERHARDALVAASGQSPRDRVLCLHVLGLSLRYQGDYIAARDTFVLALHEAESNDLPWASTTRAELAEVYDELSDPDSALPLVRSYLAASEDLEDPGDMAYALCELALSTPDRVLARKCARRASNILDEGRLLYPPTEVDIGHLLAVHSLADGSTACAARRAAAALALAVQSGYGLMVPDCTSAYAIATAGADLRRSIAGAAAAQSLRDRLGLAMSYRKLRSAHGDFLRAARENLGPDFDLTYEEAAHRYGRSSTALVTLARHLLATGGQGGPG